MIAPLSGLPPLFVHYFEAGVFYAVSDGRLGGGLGVLYLHSARGLVHPDFPDALYLLQGVFQLGLGLLVVYARHAVKHLVHISPLRPCYPPGKGAEQISPFEKLEKIMVFGLLFRAFPRRITFLVYIARAVLFAPKTLHAPPGL